MGVDGPGVAEIIVIPHVVQDLFPGQGHPLVFHKIRQKLKFLIAQIHRLAVHTGLVGVFIHPDPGCLQDLSRSGISPP